MSTRLCLLSRHRRKVLAVKVILVLSQLYLSLHCVMTCSNNCNWAKHCFDCTVHVIWVDVAKSVDTIERKQYCMLKLIVNRSLFLFFLRNQYRIMVALIDEIGRNMLCNYNRAYMTIILQQLHFVTTCKPFSDQFVNPMCVDVFCFPLLTWSLSSNIAVLYKHGTQCSVVWLISVRLTEVFVNVGIRNWTNVSWTQCFVWSCWRPNDWTKDSSISLAVSILPNVFSQWDNYTDHMWTYSEVVKL